MHEIIAIDGPASVGKSTLAKKLSVFYDSPLLQSGRLYRAVALEIKNKKININDRDKIIQCAKSLKNSNIKLHFFLLPRIALYGKLLLFHFTNI